MNDDAANVILGSLEAERLSKEEVQFLTSEKPAGLTLFSRNISPDYSEQLPRLTTEIQAITNKLGLPPFLIAIDQEGGRVRRIKAPFPNQGPAMDLADGNHDDLAISLIEAYAYDLGCALRKLGVNVNFAPVLDVLTNENNPSIGDRAFGCSSDAVGKRAGAFLKGQNRSQTIGCLKHFPGQGGANLDTHESSSQVQRTLAELKACDLKPFLELLPLSATVMISHCIYPSLDHREASLSHKIIHDLLKTELKYQGVVVSDDMTMGAITSIQGDWVELQAESIACGSDLILICKGLDAWQNATDAIRKKAESCCRFRARLTNASAKVTKLRQACATIPIDA